MSTESEAAAARLRSMVHPDPVDLDALLASRALRRQARRQRVYPDGFCKICGRALSDPESVALGIGPDCWAKVGHADALARRVQPCPESLVVGGWAVSSATR